eukprot:XP_001698331.1 predicted protein [Chlamydomonas reinhardtii]
MCARARPTTKAFAPCGPVNDWSVPAPPPSLWSPPKWARRLLPPRQEHVHGPASSVQLPAIARDLFTPTHSYRTRSGFLGRGAPDPDLLMLLDEADFPGGEVQRFRVLRPLVEAWLDGYNSEFLGFLEDGADGVGLWAAGPDTSVIANVTSATVPSLVKLLDGGYGARATQPGHTVIAVNPTWTSANSVGQPWQFVCAPRTSRGANGLLVRAWPHRWALYPAATPDARHLGDCVLASLERPPTKLLIERLAEAKPAMDKKCVRPSHVLDPAGWQTLYSARMLRSSRGANGLLVRAWPHRWALYPAATPAQVSCPPRSFTPEEDARATTIAKAICSGAIVVGQHVGAGKTRLTVSLRTEWFKSGMMVNVVKGKVESATPPDAVKFFNTLKTELAAKYGGPGYD